MDWRAQSRRSYQTLIRNVNTVASISTMEMDTEAYTCGVLHKGGNIYFYLSVMDFPFEMMASPEKCSISCSLLLCVTNLEVLPSIILSCVLYLLTCITRRSTMLVVGGRGAEADWTERSVQQRNTVIVWRNEVLQGDAAKQQLVKHRISPCSSLLVWYMCFTYISQSGTWPWIDLRRNRHQMDGWMDDSDASVFSA